MRGARNGGNGISIFTHQRPHSQPYIPSWTIWTFDGWFALQRKWKETENIKIFMVTHNPNLAVVCDAEQVIYCSFDRKKSSKITYVSGAIENPVINVHVVNVLEGTKRAFDNRRSKYH